MNTALCLSALVAGACLAGLAAEAGDAPDYLRDIKPLLKARCYACHGALKQKAGLRLDTGAAARRGGDDGPVVSRGDANKSPLILRVSSSNAEERMPPEGSALTPDQIAQLTAWITAGSSSPEDEKPEPDPRDHWAWKTPRRPLIPSVRTPGFAARNPIDALIAREWEKHGLSPAPAASKETLLRRVFLDLTGLPPTRDELQAFLLDSSSDAYERIVDRLLGSRSYAQRWARHWMDIWRYSDWYGRRHVPDVWNSAPQVWRWREWIVRSLETDAGYDQMLVEMLAADEAHPEDHSKRSATGYLVRNWYALNSNQWMRDIVEHTGKAFLGLTFNCAHCHDHKYDPITQRDYFQMRAFFEPLQVRQDWVAGEPNPGPFQKYDYSVNRKVVTHGIVSVFDENLDAKTHLYLHGDERNLPEGKPVVEPDVPAFLGKDGLIVQRRDIPSRVRYPGLQLFIRDAETRQREQALEEARKAYAAAQESLADARGRWQSTGAVQGEAADRTQTFAALLAAESAVASRSNQLAIAAADLSAIRARIAADDAHHSSVRDEPSGLRRASNEVADKSARESVAADAGRAESLLALRKAEGTYSAAADALSWLKAEQAFAAAGRSGEGRGGKKDESSDAAIQKAQKQVDETQKNLAAAQAAYNTNQTAYTPLTPVYPGQSSGRRLALAKWLAASANPLTARVAVNHIWARHFHRPLVATVFDFGLNGALPSHPEILDWLAVELVEHGWSMKHLHRLIVTSSVYRLASSGPPRQLTPGIPPDGRVGRDSVAQDPENKWLWRMNAGQMEAEAVRDSILHLAGELDPTPAGYPLPNSEAEVSRRRSLYFECFPEPNGASAFAELFDAPNPAECYRRTETIVPQQALALANSKLSNDRSRVLARRLTETLANENSAGDAAFVAAAYEQTLARRPSEAESGACLEFLGHQAKLMDAFGARASLVRVLFNHHDFITIR